MLYHGRRSLFYCGCGAVGPFWPLPIKCVDSYNKKTINEAYKRERRRSPTFSWLTFRQAKNGWHKLAGCVPVKDGSTPSSTPLVPATKISPTPSFHVAAEFPGLLQFLYIVPRELGFWVYDGRPDFNKIPRPEQALYIKL